MILWERNCNKESKGNCNERVRKAYWKKGNCTLVKGRELVTMENIKYFVFVRTDICKEEKKM